MADIFHLTVNSVIDNLGDGGMPEGEPEINIFTTEGSVSREGGVVTLSFTEESEGQSSHSVISIEDGRVRLAKSGAICSDMTFEEGEIHDTVYRVGPYAFDMQVRTKRIRNSLGDEGGELQLIYSMNVGGQEKSVRMKLTLKRK